MLKTGGNTLPGRGLINPAFIIKIVPATDELQQKPSSGRGNQKNDYLDDIKVGDKVQALVKKRKIQGTVQRVKKNSLGDGSTVIISDANGKTHEVEGSRISRLVIPNIDDDRASVNSSPALFNEDEFFLSYKDFLNS